MKSLRHKTGFPSGTIADIDVTPIMNMFIILVPFLVSMAVFTHLAVLHFALPPNAGRGLASENTIPKLKLTIVIAEEYLALTRGETMLDSVAMVGGAYDLPRLAVSVARCRADSDQADEAIVAVRNSIAFEQVVQVMDICRSAGFTKIGLSNATENPATGI
jgi:biopolymer transport protein ExbD